MPESAAPPPILSIKQAESKRVTAILAHLRQIFRTVSPDQQRILRPVAVDHLDLVLASASLRALFFDYSPSPLLLEFLQRHGVQIAIETLEIDSTMLFLSQLEPPSSIHISDLLGQILLDPKARNDFKLDEPRSFIAIVQEGSRVLPDITRGHEVWVPGPESVEPRHTSISIQPNVGAAQYSHITRKIVNLQSWGDVRIGYLKDVPIKRRNIIAYVANKLGGVHYDSNRLPIGPSNKREFRTLATAYDWGAQSIMHAGLVAVALACIEIINTPALISLFNALTTFHTKRQERLLNGDPLPPAA